MMNKVEFHLTEMGKSVASLSGRQLSSFVDPCKEAHNWVDHYKHLISGKDVIFVLGLGSGYHVDELLRGTKSKIVVVEQLPDLISHFEKNFNSETKRIQFISLDESSNEFKKILCDKGVRYSTLTFAPAILHEQKRYARIYEDLSGRSSRGVQTHFMLRGVDQFFSPEGIDFQSPGKAYRSLAQDQALSSRWQNVFKMMSELVK